MRVLGVSEDRLIMLRPRDGEYILQTQDILKVVEVEKDNIALIMLPGVQYYTGQKLDMEAITRLSYIILMYYKVELYYLDVLQG